MRAPGGGLHRGTISDNMRPSMLGPGLALPDDGHAYPGEAAALDTSRMTEPR